MQLASVTLEAFVEGGGPFSSVCGFQSKQKKGQKNRYGGLEKEEEYKKAAKTRKKERKICIFLLSCPSKV